MLSVNERISRDALRDDTMWLGRPELNVGDAFNRQISGEGGKRWLKSRAVKRGGVTWDQWTRGWRGKCFWSKDRSSKSERRYRLVVRLKAIEYKENFLCYLSSTASLHLHSPFIIFVVVLLIAYVCAASLATPVDHSLWATLPRHLLVSPVWIIHLDPFYRHPCWTI